MGEKFFLACRIGDGRCVVVATDDLDLRNPVVPFAPRSVVADGGETGCRWGIDGDAPLDGPFVVGVWMRDSGGWDGGDDGGVSCLGEG